MQKFEFLRQPLLGELAMSRKSREEKKKEREKNAIYSGHLRLCQQPRAAHALRSDQMLAWAFSRVLTMLLIWLKHPAVAPKEDAAQLCALIISLGLCMTKI